MTSPSTSDDALAALGYLTRCFGGFAIPDDEQRAFLRLFVRFPASTVRDAIDSLVVKSHRRPSPNDLAQEMRKGRPAVRDTRTRDPLPDVDPAEVSRHVAELKALIHPPKGVPLCHQ